MMYMYVMLRLLNITSCCLSLDLGVCRCVALVQSSGLAGMERFKSKKGIDASKLSFQTLKNNNRQF